MENCLSYKLTKFFKNLFKTKLENLSSKKGKFKLE
jgi:hypothetical protein